MSEKKHLNIRIYGKVQMVGFRINAKRKALKIGLAGFIRNEPDGSVCIEAEGSEKDLQEFLQWCRKGPLLAQIENLEKEEGELEGYGEFEVK